MTREQITEDIQARFTIAQEKYDEAYEALNAAHQALDKALTELGNVREEARKNQVCV